MGWRARVVAVVAVVGLLGTACGDDGSGVRTIGGTGSPTAGTGTGTGTGAATGTSGGLGAYTPVSNVDAHAKVSADVCEINALLPEDGTIDYAGIRTIYAEGKNSDADKGKRTLKGFATAERDEEIWDTYVAYYGDEAWLDTFVSGAIDGTGVFKDRPDAVRRQAIQKGVQNQILIAWVLHELVAAKEKVADGNTDPAKGAPHAVDEAWAFYHGEKPDCAPYATANKRGENFGRGTAVNDAILVEMRRAQDASAAGDAKKLDAAVDEIVRQITITYVQAAIRYSSKMSGSVEGGKADAARVEQAEGWAFFRVIEPLVAQADRNAARTIAGYLDISNEPSARAGADVKAALESVYDELGITAQEVGTLQG